MDGLIPLLCFSACLPYFFFKPVMVNKNELSKILFYLCSFSQSLQLMDSVLTHMDNPNYDMRLYTPLERIVHAAHMQEVWQEAGEVFNGMKVGGGAI